MKVLIRISALTVFLAFFLLNVSIITSDGESRVLFLNDASAGIVNPNKIPCYSAYIVGDNYQFIFCGDCSERSASEVFQSSKCTQSATGGGGNEGE